jgi:Asp-tRNA(Asn)/Glu-tRNA(Gln) amidotransferase B subunit
MTKTVPPLSRERLTELILEIKQESGHPVDGNPDARWITESEFWHALILKIAREYGCLQNNDPDAISKLVGEVLDENPDAVSDFLSGKKAAFNALIGSVMRKGKGSNPALVRSALEKWLEERKVHDVQGTDD